MTSQTGICHLSMIPLRLEPSEKTELVSMLLFGEKYKIAEEHGNWCKITTIFDNYSGWMDRKLVHLYDQEESFFVVSETTWLNGPREGTLIVYPGSELPVSSDDGNFTLGKLVYSHSGIISRSSESSGIRNNVVMAARQYLNAPYLWGGKIPGGIDCSALVQIAFKIAGIRLPRDSGEQAKTGQLIEPESSEACDLAFFENEEHKITHVGILLNKKRIIHASGFVRIDLFDNRGIFDEQKGEYTHRFHSVRKITE